MTLPQTIELHSAAPARASVIILHGLGADGTDFLPLADEMKLDAVGPLRWIFPRAPERPVTINGGMRMRAWYDVYGGFERGMREDEAGLRDSFASIGALISREVERGVPAGRIVLAGFSQGCAIALGTGLRHAQRLAGLVGLSGYLPLAAATAAECHPANTTTPVLLAHGTQDPVVDIARGRAGRDAVATLGNPVQWHEYPMEHSVCLEEIRAVERFVLAVLQSARD